MKKTTYAIFMLLVLILIAETVIFMMLLRSGKPFCEVYPELCKEETVETNGFDNLVHKDKVVIEGDEEPLYYTLPAGVVIEDAIDGALLVDTLVIISKRGVVLTE